MSEPTTTIPRSAETIVTGLALALVAAPVVGLLGWAMTSGLFLIIAAIISLAGTATFLVGLFRALQRFDRHTDLSGAGELPAPAAGPQSHLSSSDPAAAVVPGGRWGIGAPTQ